jgi:ferredoxin-type protein NapG
MGESGTDRRAFLREAAQGACGLGLIGLGLEALAPSGRGRAASAIRPPGALAEDRFYAACARCGLCVRTCPYGTLRLAERGDDAPVGTPFFTARTVPCEMCEDVPCVAACPTGALDRELTDISRARMGLAVLVGQETCLNLLGLRCDVCYRVCPLIEKAITLEVQHNARTGKHARFVPTVHGDACTGCGKCEKAYVLEEAAIKVLPIHLARGEIGGHYRLGWEEKKRNLDQPLVPGLEGLPARLPEGAQP